MWRVISKAPPRSFHSTFTSTEEKASSKTDLTSPIPGMPVAATKHSDLQKTKATGFPVTRCFYTFSSTMKSTHLWQLKSRLGTTG